MIICIANPASAGGRTAAKIPEVIEGLRARFSTEVALITTRSRGDAEDVARHLDGTSGSGLVIAVGGDGTYQEIANGLVSAGRPPSTIRLGLISSGTGQGLAQGLGLPQSLNEQLDVIAAGRRRGMDIGLVEYRDTHGHDQRRCFVNECQCGIGGAVVRDVESRQKRFGGRLEFGLGALIKTITHPDQRVQIHSDAGVARDELVMGIVVGNGAFTGGGMHLTPGASPFDGRLSLLVMWAQSLVRRWCNLSRIYSARHIQHPEFSLSEFTSLSLTSADHVPLEADGEFLGILPCSISVLPSAITVIVPGESHDHR